MPSGITFGFDPATEQAIRAMQLKLQASGLCHPDVLCQSPHITLALAMNSPAATIRNTAEALAAYHHAIPVELAGIGLFPSTGAIWLAPNPTAAMLAIHHDVHRRLAAVDPTVGNSYNPDDWMPHCTLSVKLDPQQLLRATEIIAKEKLFIRGTLERLILLEFYPIREVAAFPLAAAPH